MCSWRWIISKFKKIFIPALLLTALTTIASLLYNSVVEFNQPVNMKIMSYPLEVNLNVVIANVSNSRHVTIQPINPHPFTYTRLPHNLCDENVFLLIIVKSAVENIPHRKAIRKSWSNESYYKESNHGFKTAFMLGQPTGGDTGLNERIQREAMLHNDIVQENFMDSYRNVTYKTIMAFNWAIMHCLQAKFVLFVDDDYFVNIENVMFYILPFYQLYSGRVNRGMRPVRVANSKWYVSLSEYPLHTYPDYIAGGAFVMSMNLVKKFQYVFPFVRHLSIDDVYLGIVARKLGVQPVHEGRFRTSNTPAASWKRLSRAFTNHFMSDYQNIFPLWIDRKIPYLNKMVKRYTNT